MSVNFRGGNFKLIIAQRLLFFCLVESGLIDLSSFLFVFLDDFFSVLFFILLILIFFIFHYDRLIVLAIFFHFVVFDVSNHITNVQEFLPVNFLPNNLLHDNFLLIIGLIAFETGKDFISDGDQGLLGLIFNEFINAAKVVFVDGFRLLSPRMVSDCLVESFLQNVSTFKLDG